LASRQQFVQPGALSPDALLVAAAQRGDAASFNQLVETYQELCYNVAYRLVGNADSAADVTQDAFLSAYRHLDQFKGGSFRSWLLRVVTNASYDVLRARSRHASSSLDELTDDTAFDVIDPGELPETLALRRELFEAIQVGLQTIPVDQRAVLILYDVHGLSYDEVAVALNANLGTVKSRLSRARGRMRDYLLRHPELWRA